MAAAPAPKRAQDAKATGRTAGKKMASRFLLAYTVCEEMYGNVQNDVTSLLFRWFSRKWLNKSIDVGGSHEAMVQPENSNITKELIFCRIVLLCFVHGLFVLLQEQKPSYHRNQSALICPWAKICHGFWAVWGWLSSVIRQEYWQFTC